MHALRYDGRVVLVTGAATGLGQAYAKAFGARGASVAVNDLPGCRQDAEATVRAIRQSGGIAEFVPGDVGGGGAPVEVVTRALTAFGRLDVVVNNAGIVSEEPFPHTSSDVLQRQLSVNLGGTWGICQASWPHLAAAGAGRIVNVASNAALFGKAEEAAYAASKAGVLGMNRCLAIEGLAVGIGVNAVAPIASTRLTAGRLAELEDVFTPEAVAPAVVWLGHADCQETGSVFSVAGGTISRILTVRAAQVKLAELTPEAVRAATNGPALVVGGSQPRSAREELEVWSNEASAASLAATTVTVQAGS